MPRKPRIMSSTGIYHITLRSVNQHIIFEDDSDYKKFLFILSDCKKKHEVEIYAYCLMDNHVHLLLHSPPDKLASFFQSLGTRFVRWYNAKYVRSGHLFQERFHSAIIISQSHFLSALLYIHNNPVKANMCRFPSEYRWSSFNTYYGKADPLVNVSLAANLMGGKNNLLHYFAAADDARDAAVFEADHPDVQHPMTDERALAIFKSVTNLESVSDASHLEKAKRNEYIRALRQEGVMIKQIARLMDISPTTVKRLQK